MINVFVEYYTIIVVDNYLYSYRIYCTPDHTHAESSLVVSQNVAYAIHSQLTGASSKGSHHELTSTLQE